MSISDFFWMIQNALDLGQECVQLPLEKETDIDFSSSDGNNAASEVGDDVGGRL